MEKNPNISLDMVPEAAVKPQWLNWEDGCALGQGWECRWRRSTGRCQKHSSEYLFIFQG